jgi:hypothetical protein
MRIAPRYIASRRRTGILLRIVERASRAWFSAWQRAHCQGQRRPYNYVEITLF